MPSVEFFYRSYDPNGVVRATASRVVDALHTTGHLGSVADSLYQTLSQEAGESRMVLSVEEEPPVTIDYARLRKGLAMGHLTRGSIGAVVIMLAEHPRLIGPDLQTLEKKLGEVYAGVDFSGMFQWLKETRPPAASGFYVNEGPADVGIDTVAVALAATFFRITRGGAAGNVPT